MDDMTLRLAGRLRDLRRAHNMSLDDLARRSGISRATLSRIENATVSPTAESLARLCAAHGVPASQVLALVEDGYDAHVPYEDQAEHTDPATGSTRRAVSPPAGALAGEIREYHLPPDASVTGPEPGVGGREHHLVLLDGALMVSLGATSHHLSAGDCLRYHATGPVAFATGPQRGARYLLVLI